MAASISTGFSFPATASAVSTAQRAGNRRRHITSRAGRALEMLGHAIEYLTDEYVFEGGSLSEHNAQIQAVQMLMALNREVYFECPQAPTLGERCRSLVRRFAA